MGLIVQNALERVSPKFAKLGRESGLRRSDYEFLATPPVPNEIGDRDELEIVLISKCTELWAAHHRPIFGDELTQHSR